MFEKEIRFIHDICMNQITRLGSFVTFDELTGTDLHPAILKYISAEIDLMILEDRQKLLEQSNFDYTGEEMTDAFRQVGQIIKSSKKFPIDYISNLILLAISFNMNYLIRPRQTLMDFIFQKEEILNASFVKHMLNYTYYYSYIRKVFEKYSVKKALLTIPRSDFESILSRLDHEMFDSHTNRILDTALNSIADFFNIGSLSKSKIPLTALEPFLLEKNLDNYLDRLRSAFPAVTKFSYNIPDVQRVMYSTTPIKRESYLDKASQKKVQDSVLGIEEKVVDPKKEIAEEASKTEFQEAEFILIQDNDEQDTISRLRSKNVKSEKKENQVKPESKNIEVKTEETKTTEKVTEIPEEENVYSLSDLRQEEMSENELTEQKQEEESITEIVPDDDNPKNPEISEQAPVYEAELLENEAADLMDMYDKEMGIKKEEIVIEADEEEEETDNEIEDESETEIPGDDIDNLEINNEPTIEEQPEQDEIKTIEPASEPDIEEVVIDNDTDDDFIVVGEEESGTGTINKPGPAKEIEKTYSESDKKINSAIPEIKNENNTGGNPVKPENRRYDSIRKRRIMIKKIRQSENNEFTENSDLTDEPQDEGEQKLAFDEQVSILNETPAENNPAEKEQNDIRDIFSCFTEKELQKILKGVFNDDAEDFALTLDTIAACKNYDEATKLLRSLFRSYKIKNKSKEAFILKKAISEFYSRSNDIDFI